MSAPVIPPNESGMPQLSANCLPGRKRGERIDCRMEHDSNNVRCERPQEREIQNASPGRHLFSIIATGYAHSLGRLLSGFARPRCSEQNMGVMTETSEFS